MDSADSNKPVSINELNEKQLYELRKFLFAERIKIANEKKKNEELYEKFIEERVSFREEMKLLNSKILSERKRLKEEQSFFDKKMMILQNGFAALEMDRKAFEREKKEYRNNPNSYSYKQFYDAANVSNLFLGVNTQAGLKKRYRDLIKIFHPDNMDGSDQMVIAIKDEYERLNDKIK